MASLAVCFGEDISRFADTVIGWVVVGGLVFNVIGTAEDVISWSVAVINLVCDVDLPVGVIVDIVGIVNVAVVTCLVVVGVFRSIFDEVVSWVVVLVCSVKVVVGELVVVIAMDVVDMLVEDIGWLVLKD